MDQSLAFIPKLYRNSSTPWTEWSARGFIARSVLLSITEPGILLNLVNVELMVEVDAKKLGNALFARQAVCLLPIRAYGERL